MAGQLLNLAPHHEAKLYYSTMVQDEARHVEAWLKLVERGRRRRPSATRTSTSSAKMTLEAETLEEKVFQMQVFFERLIIPRFRLIARSSRGTAPRGPLQPAHDRRRHPPQRRRRVRARPARGCVEEDEGPAGQGRQPAAADLRRARALAAEGARLDRQRDARDGHPPPAGRRPRRDPHGLEHGARRQRHRASVRAHSAPPDPTRITIPPASAAATTSSDCGWRCRRPEGADDVRVRGDVRRPPPGWSGNRARRHRRRRARRGLRAARDLAPLSDRHRPDRDPLPPSRPDQPRAAGSRRA